MDGALETLILLAIVGLLILLRFDARRFGAADYDDEESPGGVAHVARPRCPGTCFGILLIAVVYFRLPAAD